MRRWLAALAFVPAVAWGDCYSVETREGFVEYAVLLDEVRRDGVEERAVMQNMTDAPAPIRAAFHEAIRLTYGRADVGLSSVVTAMQNACYQEARR